MINFGAIDKTRFLQEYWQKKPLLIKDAFPGFVSVLDADELAGLAMEEEVESRLVLGLPNDNPQWQLKHGPFSAQDLTSLPDSHWTLLVQGVDRLIPEVHRLCEAFDFIPAWRLDDVMISIASMYGGVGPHYDNYDVFLYQAQGSRRWSLTTKHCHEKNVVPNLDLRIMSEFEVEEEYILSAGDMLYLPPHVGHDGVALSNDCMTYSFGYRSYQVQELWDSLGDFIAEKRAGKALYRDPSWAQLTHTGEIPDSAVSQAKQAMQCLLEDDEALSQWFTRFATQLDAPALALLDEPLSMAEAGSLDEFIELLKHHDRLYRHACCRIAYHLEEEGCFLAINGEPWDVTNVSIELVKMIANQQCIAIADLRVLLANFAANQEFLFKLFQQQIIQLNGS